LAPVCTAPSTAQISASNVSANSAILNCTLTGMASYDWRYRIVGSSSWIDLAAGATNTASLSALSINTTYEFQVSVQCTTGGTWSAWSGSGTFTTISQACGQPSLNQLSVSNLTATSAQLNCSVTGAQA
jgi:hypothetical protein